jgi:hypothetical protein
VGWGETTNNDLTPSGCRPGKSTRGDHPYGANLRLTISALPRSVHADEEVGVLRSEVFQNAGVDVDAEGVFLASLRAWRRRYDDGGGLSRYLVLRPPAAPDARMPASISALMSRRAVSSEQSASLA